MDTDTQTQLEETVERSGSLRVEPDWTESEWFEVWLKLARHEYEHRDH